MLFDWSEPRDYHQDNEVFVMYTCVMQRSCLHCCYIYSVANLFCLLGTMNDGSIVESCGVVFTLGRDFM